MSEKRKTPFYNRAWFVSIALLFIVQVLFIFMEKTGWIPKYREIDGLLGKLTELQFFKQWFQFYEMEWFNIITLFFALYAIIQIIVSTLKFLTMKGIGKA